MKHQKGVLMSTERIYRSDRYAASNEAHVTAIREKDGYDIMSGFGKNVFEFGEFCAEIFEKYPKISGSTTVPTPAFNNQL